jgi:CubicO group peptidase (beta-lactamase class C family)
MEADATWWLESPGGTEIGGSGFAATLRDYGRLGLFVLQDGRIDDASVLPDGWIGEASAAKVLRGGAPLDYGYLWWPGTSVAARRDGAFMGRGIHGQYLYINPARNVVAVVWSAQPRPSGDGVVSEWAFFEAVSEALD